MAGIMEGVQLAKKFSELVKAGRIIYYESAKYYRQWRNTTIEVRHCPGLSLKGVAATATTITTITLSADSLKKNPFLPPESELVLGEVGPFHTLIFNKFAVIPLHLLIISREYVPQDSPLEAVDFQACNITLQWLNQASHDGNGSKAMDDWLFFYNSGPQSGASQPHRHLQAIPLSSEIPFIKDDGAFAPMIQHAWIKLPTSQTSHSDNQLIDHCWFEAYQQCTGQMRPNMPSNFSYSLLFTTRWMLLVPRQAEYHNGISFNALSMIGYLLARNESELDYFLHHLAPDDDFYQTIGYPHHAVP